MKISYRIFLGFAIILAAGFYYLVSWIMSAVKVHPKKAMEESLVDISHVLASYLEQNIENDKISTAQLSAFMNSAGKRKFSSRIYELEKKEVNLDVYVVNKHGIVIYDSNNGQWEGRNFARYNDVYRTMRGRYGARTTRRDPQNPLSSVAYIAAPVRYNGEIIGVCSVAKAWNSVNSFIETTRKKIITVGITGFIAALLLTLLISRWITRPIRQLTEYSDSVKEGKRVTLPKLGNDEIKTLGESFEKMRESLEGKKYIEKYVQTLTHQLKGPLSSIRGAAELLQEEIPEKDRIKFTSNIEMESKRIQRIVDRMLELASLEQQRELRNVETIDLSKLVMDIAEGLAVILERKGVNLALKLGEGNCFQGERFLIHQAVFNLIQNAVDFTPRGGTVTVEIKKYFDKLFLMVKDTGAGLPKYALDKVFDKFYSLQRPDTGQKSSGLGLSLVKEVADLHKGTITLKNQKTQGAIATLKLPISLQ